MSARDFSRALSSRLYENQERKKLVLYIAGRRIKISAKSSFVMVDDQPFQMPVIARERAGDIYLPAQGFLHILKSTTLPVAADFAAVTSSSSANAVLFQD